MSEIDQLEPDNNDNLKKIDQRKELEQLLLRLTDENTAERQRLTAKKTERIVELISGQFIGENHHLDLISASVQSYEPHFPQIFWDLICIINNWPQNWAENYIERSKHKGFADFINEVIYSRFDGSVIKYIQLQNPFVAFAIRRFKLFQFLSPKGQNEMDQFIEDAIETMKVCSSMHEFRLKMLSDFGVSYNSMIVFPN
jgi:hypothetical protein